MRTVNKFRVKKLFLWLILWLIHIGSLSFCNFSSFFQATPERSLTSSRLKSKVPRRERQRLDDAIGFGVFSVFDCPDYEDSNYFKEFRLVAKPPSEAEVERGLAQLNMITLANFEEKNRGYEQHASEKCGRGTCEVCLLVHIT